MAQGVNGHVTINVGLANGIGNGKPAPQSLGEQERERRARRLRKEGWSYRRIAASLGMSYASVCHLLDGDEARVPYAEPLPRLPSTRSPPVRPAVVVVPVDPPIPEPANQPAGEPPIPASAAARIDELTLQVRVLQQRLDTVLAMNDSHRKSLERLERVLVATLEKEHRALGQRLLAAVKSLLERMLPTGFRPRSAPPEERHDD